MIEVKINVVKEIKMSIVFYTVFSLTIFLMHSLLEDIVLKSGIKFLVFFFIFANTMLFMISLYEIIQDKYTVYNFFLKLISLSIIVFSNIFIFAYFYYFYGLKGLEGVVKNDYLISLYFSIVTWTTLGYGDFSPMPDIRFIASFEALLGQIYMALLTGLFLYAFQLKAKDTIK